jgi:hypothetical protein
VLLVNPHHTTNSATVQYLIEGGPAVTRTYPLDPDARYTIDVGADADLVGKSFGMTVTVDQPGIAERAMYFGTSPLWKAGHESTGVTAPATRTAPRGRRARTRPHRASRDRAHGPWVGAILCWGIT